MITKDSKIYVAGHNGLAGSAILRKLRKEGYQNIIYRSENELNLLVQQKTLDFLTTEKPEYVFIAAAKVGGIYANKTYSAQFIYENILIQNNLIHSSYLAGVKKLLFLGSACIYPKEAPQPLKEKYLLTGFLEPTNEPYAVAKIAGMKMCEAYREQYGCNFISLMPTNLYGPNDNYHPENSHVLPALIRKFMEAKKEGRQYVEIWGTGTPRREFLHADDLADACLFVMNHYDGAQFLNVGTGEDIAIKEVAQYIKEAVGYEGELRFAPTKPDGTMFRRLDMTKTHAMGWKHKINLKEGIKNVIEDVVKNGFERTHNS